MWTVTGLYKTNELVGELVYTTQHGSSHSKTNDIQVVSFYLERQIVRSDAKNTKGNFLLESGDHTFRLHDNLPPTLEQTRHNGPYIRYVVRIQIGIKRISNEHLLLLFDVASHQCEMIKQIENTFVHVYLRNSLLENHSLSVMNFVSKLIYLVYSQISNSNYRFILINSLLFHFQRSIL